MKTLKPLMLVVAGMVIAFLVSFKLEEPKKEYAFIYSTESMKKNSIGVTINSKMEVYSVENTYDFDVKLNEIVNNLAKEGWKIVSTDYSHSILTASSGSTPHRHIYLERTRP